MELYSCQAYSEFTAEYLEFLYRAVEQQTFPVLFVLALRPSSEGTLHEAVEELGLRRLCFTAVCKINGAARKTRFPRASTVKGVRLAQTTIFLSKN
jgi:hypothetical protein